MTRVEEASGHLVPLGTGGWNLWRDVVVRSAGFPADGVRRLGDPAFAAAVDRGLAAGRSRVDLTGEYTRATATLSEAVRGIAANPRFREAVAWQNVRLIEDCVDKAAAGEPRNVRGRNHELAIASYWQRYCVKNDTIGFFGPVGWATWSDAEDAVTVKPGTELLSRRTTYFEVWAIDALSAELSRQPWLRPWLPVTRVSTVHLQGHLAHRVAKAPMRLSDTEREILELADGVCTVRELADELAWSGHAGAETEDELFELLTGMRDVGLVRLDFEGPVSARPEQDLRAKLARIDDSGARERAVALLDGLCAARARVAAAAGDVTELVRALGAVNREFEAVTGASSVRRAGGTYAGRTILYEDAVRDGQVELGRPILDALAGPLTLLLDSARWLVAEATATYTAIFEDAYDRARERLDVDLVPISQVVAAATPHLFFSLRELPEPVRRAVEGLQRKWTGILDIPEGVRRHHVRSADIADRARREFAAPRPPWAAAVHHTPDLMMAADGPEAAAAGEFLLVLGELHVASNTVESRLFVEQHPDPARLVRAAERDHRGRRTYVVPPKHWRSVNSRTYPPTALLSPEYTYWSMHPDAGGVPGSPVPGSALFVRRTAAGLTVVDSGGGFRQSLLNVVGELLSAAVVNGFRPLPRRRHMPRVTVDRLVISRESWVFTPDECAWAMERDELTRYLAARAWRSGNALPERAFYKVPTEDKPAYVDFTSIVLLNVMAKAIRRTAETAGGSLYLTEMLPDLSQTWLPDADAARYTAELRIVAVDGSDQSDPARGEE